MKTRLIPLITAVCFGVSLIAVGAPPPKKKPDPGPPGPAPAVVVPVPVPVPVVPAPKPVPKPAPKPGPAVRFCGVERPHPAHNFSVRGLIFRCPGKVGVPKGPPRRP